MGCLEQQGFSVLVDSDGSWDSANICGALLALYMFSFHIPLSFGGLSIVPSILHRPALSIFIIQFLELTAAVILLKHTHVTNQYSILKLARDRNWLVAAVIGFGFLMLVVPLKHLSWLTKVDWTKGSPNYFANQTPKWFISMETIHPVCISYDFSQDVGNPMVKEILSDGPISKAACILVYCILTPLLEEIIYRGFLLKSLVTKMKWQQAVVVSSVKFSVQLTYLLFIIGCVLGSSYCWSGNLRTSFTIHSLSN
ncbi:Type II CAAX prenyl endopeptidase Rce1-like, partial [Dillenia turbinata]